MPSSGSDCTWNWSRGRLVWRRCLAIPILWRIRVFTNGHSPVPIHSLRTTTTPPKPQLPTLKIFYAPPQPQLQLPPISTFQANALSQPCLLPASPAAAVSTQPASPRPTVRQPSPASRPPAATRSSKSVASPPYSLSTARAKAFALPSLEVRPSSTKSSPKCSTMSTNRKR